MSDEIKAWKCPKGHVLGQVVRNGSGIRQLLLYREAIDITPGPTEIDVIAVVEGYAADVRCSVCEAVRTWVPGQEALDKLVARVLEMKKTGG
ncbi:hypothetical protein SY88_23770 [Clostridiales bacterium PH28_bin88]|nr:hypothetical protein SY88_23770 [Clostridiales bacterium PH28_bin88]